MAEKTSTSHPSKNRHHLLYPRRAFNDGYRYAGILRGEFIVKMPVELHAALHREVDEKLGINIGTQHLPKKRTLRYLQREYNKSRDKISRMTTIQKLEWLDRKLKRFGGDASWMKQLVRLQLEFLKHNNVQAG